MRRMNQWIGLWVACGSLTVSASAAWAARPSETLLPKETVGFLAISNVDTLDAQWKKTQIGQLIESPVMRPFRKDLRRQMQEHWSGLRERFGIALDDLQGVPGGEVGAAMIEPKPGQAATALLIDVTGHLAQAHALVAKGTGNLLKGGAKQSALKIDGVVVDVFELPPSSEEQLPAADSRSAPAEDKTPAPAAAPAAVPAGEPDRAVYALVGNLLVIADNLDVVRGILGRVADGAAGSLAGVRGFAAVMKRCAADAGPPGSHQVRWFIFPLGYAEAARAATLPEKRHRGKTVVEIIRHQGFGGIEGVGGVIDLAADGCQVLHRTAIFAPPPFVKSMKMLKLPNAENFTPQPWVPRDVATYTTLYVDIVTVFDNFGLLFGEVAGEGDPDAWPDVLKQMKTDPNGPHIDLRKELILNLGQRVTLMTDYLLPITTSSERLLIAIETKDEKAVAKAVEKCLKNDPTVRRKVIDGHIIWELIEEAPPAVPSISLGEIPSLGKKEEGPAPGEEGEGESKEPHFLPHRAVTVAHGQLLIASHLDFLLKVLKPIPKGDSLAESPEYKGLDAAVRQFGMTKRCAGEFSRVDQVVRPTYELIRQGKMPESESILGRALNTLSGAGKKGVPRLQQINGKNLPDYKVVAPTLGLGGMGAVSEPEGWFIKGFLLPNPPPWDGAGEHPPAAAHGAPAR